MIVRIVKLTFKNENIARFKQLFGETNERIRRFSGCNFLALYQDRENPAVFFTYSHWKSENYLEQYRGSDFFKGVWAKTKVLFAEEPQAWSVNAIKTLN